MNRHALAAKAAAALITLITISGLVGAAPAGAATTQQTFMTFYGWWDNTPPGGDIAYPKIHDTAGGKGTYADPITFATTTKVYKAGTKIWVPRVKKYFIMEDDCSSCNQDWDGEGPNGGPGLRHIDLWVGGKGGSAYNAIDCEDALTHYNADGTPVMEPIVVDPSPNEVVDNTPLFNTSTGECYGGAQPNKSIGQYKNNSNGQCLEDPNNSTTSGVQLTTAPCNGSSAQRFTFHGAFMEINNMCATLSSSKVVLQKCTGAASQQWSINPNLTISDMQYNTKCYRPSGNLVVTGSCSGTAAQWVFTAASQNNDFGVSVNPQQGSVSAGGETSAAVSTSVVSGTAQSVALSASGLPSGTTATFTPASVTAGQGSTVSFKTSASTPAGTYAVKINGAAASGTKSANYALTVTSVGANDFSVKVNPAAATVTAGSAATPAVTVATLSGSAETVALDAANVPPGAVVTFTPASVTGDGTSTLRIATTADAPAGTSAITVTGTSPSATHSVTFTLTITAPGGTPVLLSQGKPATASSVESSSYPASAAFDGSLTGARWASKEGVDPQWLRVDLGATANISQVKLTWEAAYGKFYTIQTSPDGSTWTTIFATTTGNGGTDDLTGLTGTGRYVRVNGTARGTSYGYSLFEMQVYGTNA
ncbi:Ricin-type beta-trefoil lectin domain-containing protein [Amycolatopsis xylanica]|uniref:Ricin-type beta-trefoil lectin domain-containing protein n=1 Tax=Amycolatopsis xylanica TaxID=589385 RepID=A0A1H2UIF8_9PSEU|nr:discoidin domain-containing protein [Amycolatopsis xylanica]SDW55329.1 Ricin-type beta-trefoil lectin domain-containing protein [Amycolatopsis xylanica]